MQDSNVEVVSHATGTNASIDDARSNLESIKSVISVLEKMGQIKENTVDVVVEEKPNGAIFYVVSGINGYIKSCKTVPEASQALMEAATHNDKIIPEETLREKGLLGVNLGSGVITANKDYRFIIDLLATAILSAGVGAIVGKMFKIEVKKAAIIAASSSVVSKVVTDKSINYE